jgi:hypothetical protein
MEALQEPPGLDPDRRKPCGDLVASLVVEPHRLPRTRPQPPILDRFAESSMPAIGSCSSPLPGAFSPSGAR